MVRFEEVSFSTPTSPPIPLVTGPSSPQASAGMVS